MAKNTYNKRAARIRDKFYDKNIFLLLYILNRKTYSLLVPPVSIPENYDFARRIKNDWIRIGAKDFVKYLAKVSGIDFLTKAKQFIAEYDPETETLIVVVDEQHLK